MTSIGQRCGLNLILKRRIANPILVLSYGMRNFVLAVQLSGTIVDFFPLVDALRSFELAWGAYVPPPPPRPCEGGSDPRSCGVNIA